MGFTASSSSDEEEQEDTADHQVYEPSLMQAFHLDISSHNLVITQGNSAFNENGSDDTGCVVWGASINLCQYICKLDPIVFRSAKIVLELGCGIGLPSLVSSRILMGGHGDETIDDRRCKVMATDFSNMALQHVGHHAELNNVRPVLSTHFLDWENHDNNTNIMEADIIVASDVIYGINAVLSFVNTIQRYLKHDGISLVLVAARDGRRGINEFLLAMEQAEFILDEVVKFDNVVDDTPACLKGNDCAMERWVGGHTIYRFRRRGKLVTR